MYLHLYLFTLVLILFRGAARLKCVLLVDYFIAFSIPVSPLKHTRNIDPIDKRRACAFRCISAGRKSSTFPVVLLIIAINLCVQMRTTGGHTKKRFRAKFGQTRFDQFKSKTIIIHVTVRN